MDINAAQNALVRQIYNIDSPDIISKITKYIAKLTNKGKEESGCITKEKVLDMLKTEITDFRQACEDGSVKNWKTAEELLNEL